MRLAILGVCPARNCWRVERFRQKAPQRNIKLKRMNKGDRNVLELPRVQEHKWWTAGGWKLRHLAPAHTLAQMAGLLSNTRIMTRMDTALIRCRLPLA